MKTLQIAVLTLPAVILAACSNSHNAHHSKDANAAMLKADTEQTIPASVQQNCLSCHTVAAKNEPSNAIAPPLFAVKNHLSEFSDRDEFIRHVSAWVKTPSSDQSRMPGAVKKFGLMPALPLTDEVLEEISGWIYDTPMNKPGWYAEHFQKEHGKKPSE